MDRFVFLTVDGLSHGAVFSAVALALVLIWRSTRIVNFAQGVFAVATAYLAFSVSNWTGSYWLGFAAALLGGLVLGAVAERVVIRWVENAPPLNAVIVALGLVLFLQGVLGMVYGNQYRPAQPAFSRIDFVVGGVPLLSRFDIFVFGTVFGLMLLLGVLFTATAAGLRMRAAAFAPGVSRLLGVNVAGMLTLGWALAALVGALAGMLAIPTGLGLHPTAMDLVFISGFTAAVVGGLDSPIGAVLGGLIVGLVSSYVSGYQGSGTTSLAVLGLLVVVLLVRPTGLFASRRARQV